MRKTRNKAIKFRKVNVAFLFLVWLPSLNVISVDPLFAKEEIKSPPTEAPITAVVTATRREQPIEQVSRFVTVITREEIEKSGAVFVMDLLRAIPGITVTQSGPPGRTVGLFIRGTNANHSLVMVDGVQINSPTTGQAELADLTTENIVSLENIERIEILRGPQSVLYGSDALGGVINIVTKTGRKGLQGSGRFEYGTHETFHEAGVIQGEWKNFSFSGSGSRLDTDGPGENDDFQNTRSTGHGKLQVTDNSDLDVSFHYYNALVGIDDGAFLQDPNRSQKSREQIFNTVYNISPLDAWQQSLKYSFFHDMLFSIDPRNPGASGRDPEANPFKLDTDRHTFETQSNIFLGDFDVLTFGYEFEHGRSNNKSFDRILRNHGWFLQNELTLWERWSILGGVRIDQNSFFGTEASPLVSSGYWIDKTQTKLKGSFGRGFRAPTLNELFFPGFGNESLLPEKNWGWDGGFEQFFWGKKSSFTAAYFHNSIENLIQFVGRPLRAENIAQATTQGVELECKFSPWKALTLRSAYTYLEAKDAQTRKRLLRRPWHSGRLGLGYDHGRFHFNADCILVGMREDQTGQAARPPREKNPGYVRLDLFLGFDLTPYLQIYGRVEDATNDHYQEVIGFDNPSTRFVVGTRGKFG